MAKTEIVKRHKSKRTRPKALLVRVTAKELAQLQAFATKAGLPLATWARVTLLGLQLGLADVRGPSRAKPLKVEPFGSQLPLGGKAP